MTEREKMLRGEQFETLDPQLSEDRRRAAALLSRLNALSMDAPGYREALGELLPHASDECLIRPPFYCDYGYSLFIGRGVFINFNCVMLDGCADPHRRPCADRACRADLHLHPPDGFRAAPPPGRKLSSGRDRRRLLDRRRGDSLSGRPDRASLGRRRRQRRGARRRAGRRRGRQSGPCRPPAEITAGNEFI